MWKLNLQYFGHLMQRTSGLFVRKDTDAGKDWRQGEKGTTEDKIVGWHHQLNRRVWANSRRWWRTGKPGVLQSIWLERVFHDWATEQQQLYLKKALKKKIKKAFSERAALVAQTGKDPSCNAETQVWSLVQEDPLGREWWPALVFLPGESHEQRRLMGFSPWGHKESDMTD